MTQAKEILWPGPRCEIACEGARHVLEIRDGVLTSEPAHDLESALVLEALGADGWPHCLSAIAAWNLAAAGPPESGLTHLLHWHGQRESAHRGPHGEVWTVDPETAAWLGAVWIQQHYANCHPALRRRVNGWIRRLRGPFQGGLDCEAACEAVARLAERVPAVSPPGPWTAAELVDLYWRGRLPLHPVRGKALAEAIRSSIEPTPLDPLWPAARLLRRWTVEPVVLCCLARYYLEELAG